jgi:arabinogalactan oligomer / maltooligosaccharide transport system permease protein
LTRARIVPSFEGLNLSNYAKLVDGVVIHPWQWGLLVLAALSVLVWLILQSRPESQTTTRGLLHPSSWTILALLAVVLLIASLSPAQFTSANPSSKFLLWVRNTLLISGSTGLITMVLTTTAGYALARLRFAGRLPFLKTIIFVQMFPGLLGLVATYALVNALGLVNTFSGLILAYSGGVIAFGTWIYKGYVESLPSSLDEAALVDGCTRWQAFLRVILPLSTPALVFIFLLQFIGTYTEFFLANVIVTGAENWNVGVGLRSFTAGQFTVSYGPFAAAAVLGALPIVALFYSFQRVFVSGLSSGAVKG